MAIIDIIAAVTSLVPQIVQHIKKLSERKEIENEVRKELEILYTDLLLIKDTVGKVKSAPPAAQESPGVKNWIKRACTAVSEAESLVHRLNSKYDQLQNKKDNFCLYRTICFLKIAFNRKDIRELQNVIRDVQAVTKHIAGILQLIQNSDFTPASKKSWWCCFPCCRTFG